MKRSILCAVLIILWTIVACDSKGGGEDAATDNAQDAECTVDGDCSDGLACNGVELCEDGTCQSSDPLVCNDDDPCTNDYCSEEEGGCMFELIDEDGDGYFTDEAPDGTLCGGTDCDDGNGDINPGAIEKCNLEDDDCDGDIYDDMHISGSAIRVSEDSVEYTTKSMAFSGSEYGLIWANTSDTPDPDWGMFFARVSSDGIKIGETRRMVDRYPVYPVIVHTGSEYGVAWCDYRDLDWEIYFTRISNEGVKAGDDVRVTESSGESDYPSVAFSGSEYGIAWEDDRADYTGVYFSRISASGEKMGADILLSEDSEHSRLPALAFTGSEYAISYLVRSDEGVYGVYFMRVSLEGAMVDDRKLVSTLVDRFQPPQTSITWSGSEYGIVWNDERDFDRDIFFARVSSEGTKVGEDVNITRTHHNCFDAVVTWAGDVFAASWEEYLEDKYEIHFVRISDEGVRLGESVKVSDSTGECRLPSLEYTGTEFGMAWTDDADGDMDVFFNRIGCIGL